MRVTALEEPQNTDLSRSESLASLQTLLKWGLEYSEAWAALLYEGTMSDSVRLKRFVVNLIANCHRVHPLFRYHLRRSFNPGENGHHVRPKSLFN